jgi:hypothetical protein
VKKFASRFDTINLIVVALLAGMLDYAINVAANSPPVWLAPYTQLALPVAAAVTLLAIGWEAIYQWRHQVATDPERLMRRFQRQLYERVAALAKEGLNDALHDVKRLTLRLEEHPEAVDNPSAELLHSEHGATSPARLLPDGTSIVEVYQQSVGHQVLILAEAGGGKTTMLRELALSLATIPDAAAKRGNHQRIPFIMNLSSWARKRPELSEWLESQLVQWYRLAPELAHALLETDSIIPLLDGLDEVSPAARSACVAAINEYQRQHALTPLVVCCRTLAYVELMQHEKLRLATSALIRRLTPQDVETVVARAGERLAGLSSALRDDPELIKLASMPLMLNVMLLAYDGVAADQLPIGITDLDQRRRKILADFIERMPYRKDEVPPYPIERTKRWLAWLAHELLLHGESEFYFERLGPDWLGSRFARVAYSIGFVVLLAVPFAILFGVVGQAGLGLGCNCAVVQLYLIAIWLPLLLVIPAVAAWLLRPWLSGPTSWIAGIGVLAIVIATWVFASRLNTYIFVTTYGLITAVYVGLICGLIVGTVLGISYVGRGALDFRGPLEWSWGLALLGAVSSLVSSALIFGLDLYPLILAAVIGLGVGVQGRTLMRFHLTGPNQGVGSTFRAGIVEGIAFGLMGGAAIGIVTGRIYGPGYGIASAMIYGVGIAGWIAVQGGVGTVLAYYTLRSILRVRGYMPWNYVAFLEYCDKVIFLRRTGPSYRFIHRYFTEYFASLYGKE